MLGEDLIRVVEVKIEKTESVNALRKAIKEEKKNALQHIDADTLVLWKVSISIHESPHESLSEQDLNKVAPLQPTDILSTIFSDVVEGHVHVVMKSPHTGECDSLI